MNSGGISAPVSGGTGGVRRGIESAVGVLMPSASRTNRAKVPTSLHEITHVESPGKFMLHGSRRYKGTASKAL